MLHDEQPQQLLVLLLHVVVLEQEHELHEVQLAAASAVSSRISISETSKVSASSVSTSWASTMVLPFSGGRPGGQPLVLLQLQLLQPQVLLVLVLQLVVELVLVLQLQIPASP